MKSIDINRKTYHVQDHEFEEYKHKEFFKLKMYKNVGKFERIIGLLRDIGRDMGNFQYNLLITNKKDHGGFVYENVKSYFMPENVIDIENNIDVLFINSNTLDFNVNESLKIIITAKKLSVLDPFFTCFTLAPPTLLEFGNEENKEKEKEKEEEENFYIYVENEQVDNFLKHFYFYLDEKKRFLYDNLIHLCMIVKNAGDQFEQTLQENLPFIDRWTIVDTGSTDNTVEIINRVLVGKKKGMLHHRPFVNFRETRNECLELAGHDNCKFNIMLDDTYRLKGQVRKFLSTVRDDQFADSYTMMIQSHDSEYFSNRITKQELKLRYIYKIHEVIQGDNNVQVTFPHEIGFVQDFANDYMEKRTKDRKMLDLKLLDEMLKEDPDNPRHIYYIAQTYSCLDNYEKFAEYLEKRVHHPKEGFVQEKLDACFELARCYEYRLGRPWKLAKKYYKMCYELDKTRPDSFYMIGMHYHLLAANNKKREKAYDYFLRAFQIGYPVHCQYGLKPTLSYFYLPKFLIMYCFEREQYDLCYQIVKRFFEGQHFHKRIQDDDEIKSTTLIMSNFFSMLDKYQALVQNRKKIREQKEVKEKKTEYDLVIVADGGYTTWTGSDIETKGVGGSETWVIETAVALNALGKKVIVFCNTEKTEIYKGVYFRGIQTDLVDFLNDDENVSVKNCIISRYSEYILMCAMSLVVKKKKVSLILHDLGPSGNILPMKFIDNVFCLSNWHKSFFMKNFPSMDEKNVHVLNYGYSPRALTSTTQAQTKKPFSFIYSSFPNRGLRELLLIWPKIHERIPVAELNIYSDINHPVMLQQYPDLMMDIASLIEKNKDKNIHYHGWVDKVTLENGWKRASFWLYPCTFMETFCLTAVEAAYHKVCAITNNLAGLQDTVGDRGYFFDNQENAIEKLLDFLINQKSLQKELVEKNYEWATRMTWLRQSQKLFNFYFSDQVENKEELFCFVDPKLEYAGMYNWTNDLPENTRSREIFLNILDNFKEKINTVLEVGTYAGTSLIEILKNCKPSTIAFVIDRWKNYEEKTSSGNGHKILSTIEEGNVEQIFEKNLEKYNFKIGEKVFKRKGKSFEELLKLFKENKKFDLIYVDASHHGMDVFADLCISFELLANKGLLIIDDVFLKIPGQQNVQVKDAVDRFIFEKQTQDQEQEQILKIIDNIKVKYYQPIQEILDWNKKQIVSLNCKEPKVLEIGPGPGNLFCDLVTHTVDINDYDAQKTYKHECHLKLDICREKLNFTDNFFCYGYSRHVFEDIPNPLFAFQEITRVATKGFIDTPSPLVEILRGVDNWNDSEKYRGYCHHFSLVFTDFETNTLCFVPKLPILEHVEFSEKLLKQFIEISETNPLAWNNYYIWDKDDPKKQPRIKIYSVDEILNNSLDLMKSNNKILLYENFIVENVIPTFIKSFNKIISNFLKIK